MPLRGTAGEKKARKWKPAKAQNNAPKTRTQHSPAPIRRGGVSPICLANRAFGAVQVSAQPSGWLRPGVLCRGAPSNDGGRSFSTKETVQQEYTPNEQVNKPYKAVETHKCAVPRRTLVAGQIDLTIGGEGAKTPLRKLTSNMTGTCAYW
jgi:hypothetical protein